MEVLQFFRFASLRRRYVAENDRCAMDKALSFLRVFDIAFLVPGMALYIVVQRLGYPYSLPIAGTLKLTSADGILWLVQAIVAVYGLGLICHGIQRLVNEVIWRIRQDIQNSANGSGQPPKVTTLDSERDSAWYESVANEKRDELAVYFWYLRATSWNLAAAILIAVLLWWFQATGIEGEDLLLPVAVGSAMSLVFLGYDFDRARESIAKRPPKNG